MSLINHESEAKALIKGLIRKYSRESMAERAAFFDKLIPIMGINAKSLRNKKLLDLFDKTFSFGLLLALTYKFGKVPKQTRKIWLALSLGQDTAYELKTVHCYPVSVYSLELWRSRDIRGFDVLFYVSKHAIERVALRKQENSINAICSHLSVHCSALSKAIIKGIIECAYRDFVMISIDGVSMATPFKNEDQMIHVPLVTTYIPYTKLNQKKTYVLKHIFDECKADPSLVYFVEDKLYQDALSGTIKQIAVDSCFESNTGLCGDEEYPVYIGNQTIRDMSMFKNNKI